MLEIKRSPARVSWMVMLGGDLVCTKDTRKQAEAFCTDMASKYQLEFNSTTSTSSTKSAGAA